MRWMWAVGGVVVVIVVVAVALLVALGPSDTPLAELELGDCFDLPLPPSDADDQTVEVVEQVEVIDCDKAHLTQVVLVGELNPGGDLAYPDDAALFDLIDRRCVEAAPLVGPGFGVLPVAPTETTWDRLSGRFHCLALPFGGGEWTGTLLESGQSG